MDGPDHPSRPWKMITCIIPESTVNDLLNKLKTLQMSMMTHREEKKILQKISDNMNGRWRNREVSAVT